MLSLNNFYNVIHSNLILPFTNGKSQFFYPFGTYQYIKILREKFNFVYPPNMGSEYDWPNEEIFVHCYFFDQEPYYDFTSDVIEQSLINLKNVPRPLRVNVLANSEHSAIKQDFLKKFNMRDWYYFFHVAMRTLLRLHQHQP